MTDSSDPNRTRSIDIDRYETPGSQNLAVFAEKGEVQVGIYRVTALGLRRDSLQPSHEDWEEVGHLLKLFSDALQLLIGDWIKESEDFEYGKTYKFFAKQFNVDEATIRDWVWVARATELSLRKDNLRYSHYKELARVKDDDLRRDIAIRAGEGGWSVRKLRQHINTVLGNDDRQSYADSVHKRIIAIENNVPDDERQQIAAMLRAAADRIENGDTAS